MSFILKITNPEGGTYTWDENGLTLFTSKYQAARAALRAAPKIHPSMPERDIATLARSLDAAPLGMKLTLLSGYTFTVEEA